MSKKGTPSAALPKPDNRPLLFGVILLLVSIPVLSQLVTDFFLNIDDDFYITNNPRLRSFSWDNIRAIFTAFYGGNYHPVTTLIEAVEFQLFGLKASGYHAVSVLSHLFNTWLLYRLMGFLSTRFDVRAFVTAVFLLHPMHIETVAWITDKTDLYYTTFLLLGLTSYLTYLESDDRKKLWATALFFVLSLGCKPAAIAFPLLIGLMDFYKGRQLKRDWVFKISWVLLSLIFAYITFSSLDAKSKLAEYLLPDYSWLERFFIVNYAFSYYIVCFFLPFDLSALHLAPRELSAVYYLSPLVTAVVLYGMYRWFRKDRLVMTGFLFYVFTIGLVVQLVPSGYNIVAERYTYIPYIGLSLALAGWYLSVQSQRAYKQVLGRLVILFAGAMIFLSYQRASEWKSLLSVNRSIAEHNPESPYALMTAAFQELNSGNREGALQDLEAAEAMDPNDKEVLFLKGRIHYQLNNQAMALAAFQRARVLGCNRTELSEYMAILFFQTNAMDSADYYFSEVIASDTTGNLSYYTNRALCRFNLNRFEDAISDYTTALERDSSLGNARAERGVCLAKLGRNAEACVDLRRAVSEGFSDYQSELEQYCR